MSQTIKICCRCRLPKLLSEFHKSKKSSFGVHAICKACKAAYMKQYASAGKLKISKDKYRYSEHGRKKIQEYTASEANKLIQKRWIQTAEGRTCRVVRLAKYRSKKLQAMPSWADLDLIREFYRNCPKGMAVDHIIPLQGENVSGLHLVTNLQYLSKSDNSKKCNLFDGTVANESWKAS